jgi:rSAM/selenodomain-associated transferase 2
LNEGAKIAQGELLVFLHADTRLPKDIYRILEPYINELHWGRFNVKLSGDRWVFRVIETMMNRRSCLTGIATGDQAIFVAADLFNKVKGFPIIPLMEDIAISKRLKKFSLPICLKHTVETSSRRWEEKGVLATIWLMWRLRWSFFFNTSPEILAKRYKN